MQHIYYQGQDQDRIPKYQIYSVAYQWRKVEAPVKGIRIRIDGETVSRYVAPVVTQYIDLETGEILDTKDLLLLKDSAHWSAFPYGERVLLREAILNSLRPEVRHFALFVLAFRNNRRGVTPPVADLVKMYAKLHDKSAFNIRRYVKRLEEVGIIGGSSILGPLFQFAGTKTKAKEHSGEDAAAAIRFAVMQMKQSLAPERTEPSLDQQLAA